MYINGTHIFDMAIVVKIMHTRCAKANNIVIFLEPYDSCGIWLENEY